MTDTYYECQIHGMQYVDKIEIKQKQRSCGPGFIETTYKLRCGCVVINQQPSRIF